MEFDSPDRANEVIRKGLNLDGQTHPGQRYISQSKIMRCFNCQTYGHIGNRYLSAIKCAKYEVTITQNLVAPITAVVTPVTERIFLEATTARHESRKKKE